MSPRAHSIPSLPFFSPLSERTAPHPLSSIGTENGPAAFHYLRRACMRLMAVRLEFHKILSEGRSVKYDREEDVIHLNVIVTQEELRRTRTRRTS